MSSPASGGLSAPREASLKDEVATRAAPASSFDLDRGRETADSEIADQDAISPDQEWSIEERHPIHKPLREKGGRQSAAPLDEESVKTSAGEGAKGRAEGDAGASGGRWDAEDGRAPLDQARLAARRSVLSRDEEHLAARLGEETRARWRS